MIKNGRRAHARKVSRAGKGISDGKSVCLLKIRSGNVQSARKSLEWIFHVYVCAEVLQVPIIRDDTCTIRTFKKGARGPVSGIVMHSHAIRNTLDELTDTSFKPLLQKKVEVIIHQTVGDNGNIGLDGGPICRTSEVVENIIGRDVTLPVARYTFIIDIPNEAEKSPTICVVTNDKIGRASCRER